MFFRQRRVCVCMGGEACYYFCRQRWGTAGKVWEPLWYGAFCVACWVIGSLNTKRTLSNARWYFYAFLCSFMAIGKQTLGTLRPITGLEWGSGRLYSRLSMYAIRYTYSLYDRMHQNCVIGPCICPKPSRNMRVWDKYMDLLHLIDRQIHCLVAMHTANNAHLFHLLLKQLHVQARSRSFPHKVIVHRRNKTINESTL